MLTGNSVDKLEQALTGTSSVVQMMRLLADCDKPQLIILSGQPEANAEAEFPDLSEQLQVYDRDGTVYDYAKGCYRELTDSEVRDHDEYPRRLSADEILSRLGELLTSIRAVV